MVIRRTNQPIQTKQNNSSPSNHAKLTFLEHFYELRKRLFWIALTLAVTTTVGLEIKDWLIAVIVAPLKGARLIYLTPGGGFSFIFTLSLYFGALLTIPVVTYHIYRFLQPMLQTTSRRFVLTFVGVSTCLALLGACLAYFLAIPSALGFLNDVSGNSIVPNLTADSYLRFVVTYTVGLAALFQIPLLIFLFDHIRPIPPGILKRTQRYGIVVSAVLAGFITPSPDLMNYAIVLFPIIGAYELGVLAVYIRRRFIRGKNTAQVSVAISQPAVETTPLTAIIEGIAADTETQESVEEQFVPEPVEVLAQVATREPTSEPAIPVVSSSPVEPAVVPAQNHHIVDIQPMSQQQAPVVAQPQPRVLPTKNRSIDGVNRVPARYKTDVHVPTRQDVQKPKVSPQKSIDGFLTAQA